MANLTSVQYEGLRRAQAVVRSSTTTVPTAMGQSPIRGGFESAFYPSWRTEVSPSDSGGTVNNVTISQGSRWDERFIKSVFKNLEVNISVHGNNVSENEPEIVIFNGTGSMSVERTFVKIGRSTYNLEYDQNNYIGPNFEISKLGYADMGSRPTNLERLPLWGLEGKTLYIFHDLCHENNTAGKAIFKHILKDSNFLNLLSEPRVLTKEEILEQFLNKGLIQLKTDNKKQINKLEKEVSNYEKSIGTNIDKITLLKHTTYSDIPTKEELDKISKNTQIVEWGSEKDALFFITQPIDIEYEGDKYELGKYKIMIGLNKTIKITSVNNPKAAYPHPHIERSNPCWGNIGMTVQKLLNSGQLSQLLVLIVRYLKTYNDESPHKEIRAWR
jgi:hypothetical protein